VNSLSNSVTLINFAGNSTVNIAVGTQPMAVVLSSDGSKAYIPNFGSGTLSEVNIQPRA
jgi:DNA-binding beta-propeller fold protein YncE